LIIIYSVKIPTLGVVLSND